MSHVRNLATHHTIRVRAAAAPAARERRRYSLCVIAAAFLPQQLARAPEQVCRGQRALVGHPAYAVRNNITIAADAATVVRSRKVGHIADDHAHFHLGYTAYPEYSLR